MSEQHHAEWRHHHNFYHAPADNEGRTRKVMLLTAVTMVAEIAAGLAFGSMALLADGWHMGTHVGAFVITLYAYRYLRHNTDNPDFCFGPGKITVLGGFASAIALAVVALIMVIESVGRFWSPVEIGYGQALLVAGLGLAVNIASAFILHGGHGHAHDADHHSHGHEHHHDHNLKAAYIHVLADALTSVLAIVALLFGSLFGWWFLDPLMGIVGAMVILIWARGLVRETSAILLDADVDRKTRERIRTMLEQEPDTQITDLHVWRVGPQHLAAMITLISHHPRPVGYYRQRLTGIKQLEHLTIEVVHCENQTCHSQLQAAHP